MITYAIKELEINDKPVSAINLTNSEFSDIIFTLSHVEFSDPNEDDMVTMSFNYDIIESNSELSHEQDMKFKNIIGDLIIQILEKQVTDGYNGDVAFLGGK